MALRDMKRSGMGGLSFRSLVLLSTTFALASLAFGCDSEHAGTVDSGSDSPLDAQPDASDAGPQLIRGVALSWLGFPFMPENADAAFSEIGSWSHASMLQNAAWRDDAFGGSDSGEIPRGHARVAQEAINRGFTSVAVFGWRSGDTPLLNVPENATADWSNAEGRTLFIQTMVDFADRFHPPYMFLGNESDIYFQHVPVDYARWLDAYNEAYDAIKAVSPDTAVGPCFNYEHLAGVAPAAGYSTPQWGAIDDHDLERVDAVAITTYPWLAYSTPTDMPDDYLDELASHIGNARLVITETGWPAEAGPNIPVTWATTDQAQLDYISQLQALITRNHIELVTWLYLYALDFTLLPENQQNEAELFYSISLRDIDGTARPSLAAWQAL